MSKAPAPRSYTMIAKWCQAAGLPTYYRRYVQKKAASENAPLNAISPREDGSWATTDDIDEPNLREKLGLPPKP